jgi:hypothetical protein
MKKNEKIILVIAVIALVAIFAFGPKLGLFATVPIPSGTIAYLPMDSLTDDVTGINLTTLDVAGMPTLVEGYLGSGYLFDGVDDMLLFPLSPDYNFTSWTISVWVNPTVAKQGYVLAKTDTFLLQHYMANATATRTEWATAIYRNTSNPNNNVGTGPVSLDTWSHLVFTYDNTGSRFYLNGTLVSRLNYTYTFSMADRRLTIGNRENWETFGNRGFQGIIDEVMIAGRALSASEVTSLFNSYVAAKNEPVQTGLIVNPSFDTSAANWTIYIQNPNTTTVTLARNTVEYNTVPASLALNVVANNNTASIYSWYLYTSDSKISVEAGKTYELNFTAKATLPFNIQTFIKQGANPWTEEYTQSRKPANITTSWTKYKILFLVNATASDARVSFYTGNQPVGSTFYIDTVSLRETTETIPVVCGNGICDTGETPSSCSADCLVSSVYAGWFYSGNTCAARNITQTTNPYNSTFLSTQAACTALITTAFPGWFFGNNQCTALTLNKISSPYNTTFLQTQAACVALIVPNVYTGYELANNTCTYKNISSGTNPYSATFKATLSECTALITANTYAGFQYANGTCTGQTITSFASPYNTTFVNTQTACNALISSNGTVTNTSFTTTTECVKDSECVSNLEAPNDCSIMWQAKTVATVGKCTMNKCEFPLSTSTCSDGQVFLQNNKYTLLIALLAVLGVYMATRKKKRK